VGSIVSLAVDIFPLVVLNRVECSNQPESSLPCRKTGALPTGLDIRTLLTFTRMIDGLDTRAVTILTTISIIHGNMDTSMAALVAVMFST